MKKLIKVLFCCMLFFGAAQPAWTADKAVHKSPHVILETSLGSVELELSSEKAPSTVNNFLGYVREGLYDGTIFHRVIRGFMIQGGGFTADMQKKATQAPIQNEADNGLTNLRGTIAMARTMDPHSASSQFFINTVDNAFLNHSAKTARGWGYCVFGKVVSGMDVVDKIENVATTTKMNYKDVPAEAVIIKHAKEVK